MYVLLAQDLNCSLHHAEMYRRLLLRQVSEEIQQKYLRHLEQHFRNRQCLFQIQAEDIIRVTALFSGPGVIMLLRTEEVHDVSATARPILFVLQIDMKDMDIRR